MKDEEYYKRLEAAVSDLEDRCRVYASEHASLMKSFERKEELISYLLQLLEGNLRFHKNQDNEVSKGITELLTLILEEYKSERDKIMGFYNG